MRKQQILFHAHHSPMGAHSSFTIGMFGSNGGMALEKSSPADQSIFVGYRSESGINKLFPFYENLVNDAERFSLHDSNNKIETAEFTEDERLAENMIGLQTSLMPRH